MHLNQHQGLSVHAKKLCVLVEFSLIILQSPVCLEPPCVLQTAPRAQSLLSTTNILTVLQRQAATSAICKWNSQLVALAAVFSLCPPETFSIQMASEIRQKTVWCSPPSPAALVFRVVWNRHIKNGKKENPECVNPNRHVLIKVDDANFLKKQKRPNLRCSDSVTSKKPSN